MLALEALGAPLVSSFVRAVCACLLQGKQTEMEGVKQQLVEVEKQREEHGDTIGKLKQVMLSCPVSS